MELDGIDKVGETQQTAAEPASDAVDVIRTKSTGEYDFSVAEDGYELNQGEAVVVYDDGMFGVIHTEGEDHETLATGDIGALEDRPEVVEAGNYQPTQRMGDHNLSEGELNRAAFDASDGELPAYVEDDVVHYHDFDEDVQEPQESITDDIVIFGQGEFEDVF